MERKKLHTAALEGDIHRAVDQMHNETGITRRRIIDTAMRRFFTGRNARYLMDYVTAPMPTDEEVAS